MIGFHVTKPKQNKTKVTSEHQVEVSIVGPVWVICMGLPLHTASIIPSSSTNKLATIHLCGAHTFCEYELPQIKLFLVPFRNVYFWSYTDILLCLCQKFVRMIRTHPSLPEICRYPGTRVEFSANIEGLIKERTIIGL